MRFTNPKSADPGADLTVLVVDDDAPIRELLAEMLGECGLTVIQAGNGREAVRLAMQSPVDLVITDLIMPEQEGLETIRELRRKSPHLKVIAMSGYQDGAYLRYAEVFGARAVLKKPFSIDAVMHTVADVLAAGPLTGPGSVLEKTVPK